MISIMPRKFRLSVHRKNEERNKAANEVIPELQVSLSIVNYKLAKAPSLLVLQRRLSAMNVLPEGMLYVYIHVHACIVVCT